MLFNKVDMQGESGRNKDLNRFALENREIWRTISGAIGWLLQGTDNKKRGRRRG